MNGNYYQNPTFPSLDNKDNEKNYQFEEGYQAS